MSCATASRPHHTGQDETHRSRTPRTATELHHEPGRRPRWYRPQPPDPGRARSQAPAGRRPWRAAATRLGLADPATAAGPSHVTPGPEFQATTTQLCGLFPFVAGSGTPAAGTPVGRHQLWGEVVCLDPLAWLRAGLVTNPGMFVLGQPGTGKSALVKTAGHRGSGVAAPRS